MNRSKLTFHHSFQRFLHDFLGHGVQGGGGFVKDQDGWVLYECSGDGQALLLSAAHCCTAFADYGIVAVRKVNDKVVRVGKTGSRLHVGIRRLGAPVTNVFAHGRVEELRLLVDEAQNSPPQELNVEVSEILVAWEVRIFSRTFIVVLIIMLLI